MDGQSENFQKGIGKDEKILEISHRAEKYDEQKENRTKQSEVFSRKLGETKEWIIEVKEKVLEHMQTQQQKEKKKKDKLKDQLDSIK